MANHHKPSRDELKAGMAESLEKLEVVSSTPPVEEEKPVVPPVVETPPILSTPPVEEAKPVVPEVKEEEKKVEEIDWQKKFAESAREAQVLGFKNKEINKAVDDASALPEPTPEELAKEFSEWEDMTPTEQRLARDTLINKRRFEIIHQATAKFKDIDAWNDKVEGFVSDPTTLIDHPELEGKIEEFKAFATKPTRRGIELSDLILAFNGELAKNKPAPKKGQMFEQGSGGPAKPSKPNDGKISQAEAEILKQSDYPKFKQMLIAGKIRSEV